MSEPEARRAAQEVFASASPVVMVQLPSVFALLAPPTRLGVSTLDRVKERRQGKNYGTAVGDVAAFHAMARPDRLPEPLRSPGAFGCFLDSFVRIRVGARGEHSPLVRDGTHQALLLDGPHRALFEALEAASRASVERELVCGHAYAAPLCTSANMSGDPLGSITDWERAEAFAEARGVSLVLRASPAHGAVGSYPIFEVGPERIVLRRRGPGEDAVRAALPRGLVVDEAVPPGG